MRERGRGQPTVDLVERAPCSYRGERGRERSLGLRRVVHVVRRDDLDTGSQRELRERVVAVTVERVAVVPQLDEHAVATEPCDQLVERATRGGRPVTRERSGDRALAAPGEHEPTVGRAAV